MPGRKLQCTHPSRHGNSDIRITAAKVQYFFKKGDTFLLNSCIIRKKGYFFNKKTINTKDLLTFVFIVHLTFRQYQWYIFA